MTGATPRRSFQGRRRPADIEQLGAIAHRCTAASDGLLRPIVITTDHTRTPDSELILLRDPDKRTHVSYGAGTPSMFLIRPDGYIGLRCPTSDEAELVSYFWRHFGIAVSAPAGTVHAH